MDEKKLKQKIRIYRNLPQYKDFTPEQLRELVLQKYARDIEDRASPDAEVDVREYFTEVEEKAKAVELYQLYRQDFVIESISDKNMLVNLVYLEVLNYRFQQLLNKSHDKDSKTVSTTLIDSMHSNLDKIMSLKEKLGINRAKHESAADALKLLQKKYRIWLSKNQATRTCTCSHCGRMLMFLMRMPAWDLLKHPYFDDRLVYNTTLFAEYDKWKRTGQPIGIDEVFVANVLGVSPDYIEDVIQRRKGKAPNDSTTS